MDFNFFERATSYASWPARICANRLIGGRVPARFSQARAALVLSMVAALPMAVTGCGSGVKGADRSEGWYDANSVQQFSADTANSLSLTLEPEYVIGVNDVLEVVFLYHSNLTTRDLIVRRDGRISMPFVGDQMAAGITPMVLDSLLTTRFSEVLREPNLSVIVSQPAPQKVYVLGEVNAPGRFEFADELSMLQAVAMAGGATKAGMSNHAVLIRRQGVSKIVGVEVDLQAVMNGSRMSNDLRLRNYDIVMVPKHPLYSAADFMQVVGDIINVPLDAVFKGWQIANLKENYQFYRTTAPIGQ
jgi:polysaccharide export outer membrane protein